MALLSWMFLALVVSGCASGGPRTPDAIYRHPVTSDVQWCDKGPVAAAVVLGGAMGAAQAADYAGCKTAWEEKGYVRLPPGSRLSPTDQQRYTVERERLDQAVADSIRKK